MRPIFCSCKTEPFPPSVEIVKRCRLGRRAGCWETLEARSEIYRATAPPSEGKPDLPRFWPIGRPIAPACCPRVSDRCAMSFHMAYRGEDPAGEPYLDRCFRSEWYPRQNLEHELSLSGVALETTGDHERRGEGNTLIWTIAKWCILSSR